ncbi:MAG TPA: hypothetical protein PL143_10770 [Rhodocyclaceae bacterium]|nr:hypothetical protein [Rhodocyclaceae bacterium]
MKDWPPRPTDPGHELEEADILLRKADALLNRHRSGEAAHADAAGGADDIPILTDVVPDFAKRSLPAERRAASPQGIELAELLVGLDTELAREIETWFANELPQLVTRELDRLAAKLREEAIAHMRATLMPTLSERIAKRLGRAPRDDG